MWDGSVRGGLSGRMYERTESNLIDIIARLDT